MSFRYKGEIRQKLTTMDVVQRSQTHISRLRRAAHSTRRFRESPTHIRVLFTLSLEKIRLDLVKESSQLLVVFLRVVLPSHSPSLSVFHSRSARANRRGNAAQWTKAGSITTMVIFLK